MYEEHIEKESDDWIDFTLKTSDRVIPLLFYVDADWIITKEVENTYDDEGYIETKTVVNWYDVIVYDEQTDDTYSINDDSKKLLNLGYTEEELEEMNFIGYKIIPELLEHWDYYPTDDNIEFEDYNRKWDKMKFDYKFKF